MNPTGQLLEIHDSHELRELIANLLDREGAVLEVRPFNEVTLASERTRRYFEARALTEKIFERLQFHGIKPIDMEVQAAGRRLLEARRS